MFEEMNKCRALFTKFGGHKLAAGLSLKEENVERFRESINECANLTEDDLTEKISIDMQLPLRYVNESLIQELELLEPFGKGNPKPLFAEKNLKVINPRIIGKNKNVLKFKVQDKDGYEMDAICFGDVEACLETIKQSETMAFTYYPSINEFRGERTIQMVVQNYNPSK